MFLSSFIDVIDVSLQHLQRGFPALATRLIFRVQNANE